MSNEAETEKLDGELLPERVAMSVVSTEPVPPGEEVVQTPPITEDEPPTE